jgi:spore maturation protein CgeB
MIRFFKASMNYEAFLNYVHKKHPGITAKSYKEYSDLLFSYAFAESNFFKLNLEKTGSYVVEEVISNERALQKKWAAENGVNYTESNWYYEILEAQLLKFKPDVFFAHDHRTLAKGFLNRVRHLLPGLKLILGWDGIDVENAALLFADVDIVLTPADFITAKYGDIKKIAYTLPFTFESSIVSRLTRERQAEDVCFVGSVSLNKDGHFQRKDLLISLMKQTNIGLYLSGSTDAFQSVPNKPLLSLIKRNKLKDVADIYRLSRRSKGSLFGIDMYQKFYNSKITINNHGDAAGDNAGNIRLFEATGTGTCLLTDYKKNLEDFFEIDKEIVVFKDPADCIKKINYLLQNEDKRMAIAAAGQKRTLNEYSYAQRMNKLDRIIKENL